MSRVTLFVFSLSASRNWQNISLIEMAIRGCPHLKLFTLYDELQAPDASDHVQLSSPAVYSYKHPSWDLSFPRINKTFQFEGDSCQGTPQTETGLESSQGISWPWWPCRPSYVDHIMLPMATLSLTLPRTPYTLQDGLYSVHSTVLCTATSRITCLILHLVNCKCDEYLDLSVHHTAPQTDQACVSPSYRPLLRVCRLGPPPDRTTQGFPNCWTVMSDNTHITHT